MDLVSIQQKLRTFAKERGWDQYHSPKNLSMALAIEAAELMEIFQWVTSEESRDVGGNSKLRNHPFSSGSLAPGYLRTATHLIRFAYRADRPPR